MLLTYRSLVLALLYGFLTAVVLKPEEQQPHYDRRVIDQQIADGRQLREKGSFLQASALLVRAAERAHAEGYRSGEARALLAEGACQIQLFRYRSALRSLMQAENLSATLGKTEIQGAASLNEATAYSELGDFALGLDYARKAVVLFRKTPRRDYTAQALLVRANLQAETEKLDQALPAYAEVIRLCQEAHLPSIEASVWEDEGEILLDDDHLAAAEGCLRRAYSLRLQQKQLSSLAVTVYNLADLARKQGQYDQGLRFLDQLDSLPSDVLSQIPPYELLTTRGELFAALGHRQSALSQFYKAVLSANRMRASSLPATNLHTTIHLQRVYADYVDLACQLAIRYQNQPLARRALGVLATSRAAAYRDELTENLNREGRLPPQYLEVLAQLQEAQAKSVLGDGNTSSSGSSLSSQLRTLRLRLAEMENQLSLQSSLRGLTFKTVDPSRMAFEIQSHLSPTELLLSISLGTKESYLWAVTSREFHLYRLSNRKHLEDSAESFAQSIRNNSGVSMAGLTFAAELTGQIPPHLMDQSDWLLSADGKLLDGIPFSALPLVSSNHKKLEPLVLGHTLRLLPSGDLETRFRFGISKFLGMGDPVYNMADPRWKAMAKNAMQTNTGQTNTGLELGRLVASRREVEAAVKSLHPATADLLFGEDATLNKLAEALSHRPNILHFAVHVVSPPGRPQEAALALSLSKTGMPALITPERIALYRVPGSLVVLSGCASQQGAILPIVGVAGISRSWLIAGAGAVVVSAWPTPDTDGRFFSIFYQAFRADTSDLLSTRTAEALHVAQRDFALADSTHRNTALWAAFSAIATD